MTNVRSSARKKKAEEKELKAILSILGRIPEFASFSTPQLVRMARCPSHTWGPEEFIISEGGDNLDQMIVVLVGDVSIRKRVAHGEVVVFDQVAEISAPAIIGENSFFTGMPRSAGVYATREAMGLILQREDLMRLISLDKSSFVSFLRQMATENLQRAERTLVYYMGTLQLVLKQALVRRSHFYKKLDRMHTQVLRARDEVEVWEKLVSDILIFIRDLNTALEALYQFAHLPDITLVSVDERGFVLGAEHHFHPLFARLVEEMTALQSLVPLRNLNFRDIVLTMLVDDLEKTKSTRIDYPAVINRAALFYDEFITHAAELGMQVAQAAPRAQLKTSRTDSPLSKLLWEQS